MYATIYDIARLAGVSVATVNRAFCGGRINAQTREKILRLSEENGYKPNKSAARLRRPVIRIGCILWESIDAFYTHIEAGFSDTYSKLIDNKIFYCCKMIPHESCFDRKYYEEYLTGFASEGYDGVIISSVYNDEIRELINSYISGGMNIVLLCEDIPDSKRTFFVGGELSLASSQAAELLYLATRDKPGSILYFAGDLQTRTHSLLLDSFKKASSELGLGETVVYDTKESPQNARNQIISAFNNGGIKGIYISTANSRSVCGYLSEIGSRIVTVVSDVYPELSEYMAAGIVSASIFQSQYRQACIAFENLYKNIAEGASIPSEILTVPQIIMPSTVRAYLSRDMKYII